MFTQDHIDRFTPIDQSSDREGRILECFKNLLAAIYQSDAKIIALKNRKRRKSNASGVNAGC